MTKQPFIIQNLHIKKMPGLPGGLPRFDELAPGINIISGPNASGKSSTARLIQQLIWHNHTKGIEAEASILLNDNQPWNIQIDSGQVSLFHNGRPEELPGIPPVEGSHRYWLALDKLVIDEDSDTAEAIIQESSGGFDLDDVHKKLHYSSNVSNKNAGEFRELEKTNNKLRETRSRQERIKRQEESLQDLYQEKEDAERNHLKSTFYSKLADFAKARQAYNEASEVLQSFHPAMEKMNGEEWKNIQKYEETIRETQNALEKTETEIQELSGQLARLSIPESGIEDPVIEELEARTVRLSEMARELKNHDRKIESLKVKSDELLKAIGPDISTEAWTLPDLHNIGQLDEFLQKAQNIIGQKSRLTHEAENLNHELERLSAEHPEPENLRKAIEALNGWLTDQKTVAKLPGWTIPVIFSLGVITALATYFAGPYGLFGILFMAGAWMVARNKSGSTGDTLELRKKDFSQSGLRPPENWHDSVEITTMLNRLLQQLHEAIQTEETRKGLASRKQDIQTRLDEIQKQYENLIREKDELKEKIQAVPDINNIGDNDFSSLVWLLTHIKKWQDNHTELSSLRADHAELQKQFENELNACNAHFQKFGFTQARDAVQANAVLSEIKKQENTRRDLTQKIRYARKENTERQQTGQNAREELQNIYKKLALSPGDKETVKQLAEQIDTFKEAKNTFSKAKTTMELEKQKMEQHSLFQELSTEVETLTAEEAGLKAEEFAAQAQKRDDIQKQITEIETQVKTLKSGHELEDVLAQKEAALENLENLYHKNVSGLTGDLIIEELKSDTRDQNRPEVFKRASKLFNRITAGRYELRLDSRNEAAFTAFDTRIDREQPLGELSTGTRVQLLLAVRLAFIERQESSVQVPLLADELLANSDDQRASAIIQALLELSREGRQIFYFTAQHDEVRKWKAYLDDQDNLKFKTIELKGNSEAGHTPVELSITPDDMKFTQKIPHPGGMTHEEYGRTLEVPAFDIVSRPVSSMHLWYLIEDVELLHQCLSLGISHWGQLESFLNHGGQIPGMEERQRQIIHSKAELLKRFKELYAVGRPKAINREVLE
ncbi:MAG: ATP-binding protein, partial [Marinilabiliaceae bacterium]